MDIESLFRRDRNYVYVRLVLEDWTELPKETTEEWTALTQLLTADTAFRGGRVREVQHDGVDLYLLVKLDLSTSIETLVEALRRQLQDPFWRPFIDVERFAWVGDYHAVSVSAGDTLARSHWSIRLGVGKESSWSGASSGR